MLKSFRSRIVAFTVLLLLALQALDFVVLLLTAEVEPGSTEGRWLMVRVALLSVLLGALVSFLLASVLTSPITRLARAAVRMESGDYDTPVSVEGPGEISLLATCLDHMRTAIDARQREMLRLAYFDHLTGLPNRSSFAQRVEEAVQSCTARGSGEVSVLLMDLDRFRGINDCLGHEIGDETLKAVAARLTVDLPPGDVVARLGGDEFAMLVRSWDPARVHLLAKELAMRLEEPVCVDGQPVDVAISIGIATWPAHGVDSATLLRNADVAMATAKRRRSGYACYDPACDEDRNAHLTLLGELRHALEQGQIQMCFQPKLALDTQSVPAVEALMRWEHPERGVVAPSEFVPFAEQTGYIRHLTRWALEHALRACAEWRKKQLNIQVAVNISARDLAHVELPAHVAELLRAYGVPPRLLCLEITESGFMSDPELARLILIELSELGVRLAIDDYGTGYSSLSYLLRLPVNELKIDQSFVTQMGHDRHASTIVKSTIEMARSLGLTVVAEGVEEEESLERLVALGCDQVQGYHVAPPLTGEALVDWVMQRKRDKERTAPRRNHLAAGSPAS